MKEDTKLGVFLLGIALLFNFCAFTVVGSVLNLFCQCCCGRKRLK